MPGREGDEDFMRLALDEAALGDFPFGAVVTRDGAVLARGRNRAREAHDPTAHAELEALRAVIATGRPDRLKGATLYATGEPCAMCMGAILWCGIGRLVFAAPISRLAASLGQIGVGARALAAAAPFSSIEVEGGLLADEALSLFEKGEKGRKD